MDKHGVKVLVDLPGVGDTYHGQSLRLEMTKRVADSWFIFHIVDHQVIFPPYHATEDSDTLDGIVRGNAADVESESLSSDMVR